MQLEVLFANLPSNLKLTDNGLIVSFYTHSLKKNNYFSNELVILLILKIGFSPGTEQRPLFAALLLTDEDPYVDVDLIHDLARLRLMRREAEVKTTRLRLKPSSFAIRAFLAVSLNIYHRRFDPPMNHVCFLAFGCKKKNQTVRREIN